MRTTRRNTGVGRALALFAASFAALVLGGYIAVRTFPALWRAGRIAPVVRYPDASWQLASRGGLMLDHATLWNDFGGATANARHADVLILGNSRTQFAFPSEVVRDFERRYGLMVFNLALPVEAWGFFLRLIEKFELRPRLVIVNVDEFFVREQSWIAEKTIADGWWNAAKLLFEEHAAAVVWPRLGVFLPSFVAPRSEWYLLRSSADGTWRPEGWPYKPRPIPEVQRRQPSDRELLAATRFHRVITRLGATAVFTCVPAPKGACTAKSAQGIAARIGMLAITPRIEGLEVCDGSHLCPDSGQRFARAFFRDLGVGMAELGLAP